tara:strand:+ start:1104 stop:1625 length:522 start_codon:yes stop_codon:yes gene_type:complete
MKGEITKINHSTPELASKYVAHSDDHIGTPATQFTLTPSTAVDRPASEGWEDVTYYTSRLIHHKVPKGAVNCQWVYILSNTTLNGMVKIGFTKNRPSERVKQINAGTGVAMDFSVEWAFPCYNAHDLEKEVHIYLQQEGFRVNNNKEFFYLTVQQAKAVIQRIGEPYRMVDNE